MRENNPAINISCTSGRLGLTCNNEWRLQERSACSRQSLWLEQIKQTPSVSQVLKASLYLMPFCKSHLVFDKNRTKLVVCWESKKSTSGQCFKHVSLFCFVVKNHVKSFTLFFCLHRKVIFLIYNCVTLLA